MIFSALMPMFRTSNRAMRSGRAILPSLALTMLVMRGWSM
jgi:hypothetical protein